MTNNIDIPNKPTLQLPQTTLTVNKTTSKNAHLTPAALFLFDPMELSKHLCSHYDSCDICMGCPYNRDPECNCCLHHKLHKIPPAIDYSEIKSIIEHFKQRAKQLTGAAN